MIHKHKLSYTGKKITAAFRKQNWPGNVVVSSEQGEEAFCMDCNARLIVHNDRRLGERMTELERIS